MSRAHNGGRHPGKVPYITVARGLTVIGDSGCKESPSCLSCPLPQCIYDGTPSERLARYYVSKEVRRVAIAQTASVVGLEVAAARHGVSMRTVERALHDTHEATGRVQEAQHDH